MAVEAVDPDLAIKTAKIAAEATVNAAKIAANATLYGALIGVAGTCLTVIGTLIGAAITYRKAIRGQIDTQVKDAIQRNMRPGA